MYGYWKNRLINTARGGYIHKVEHSTEVASSPNKSDTLLISLPIICRKKFILYKNKAYIWAYLNN